MESILKPKGSVASVLKTDGSIEEVAPKNGTDFQLDELKGFVEGYIEIVYLRDGSLLVVNEEGKIHGLAPNALASILYAVGTGCHDGICGNALWCAKDLIR